MFSQHPLLLILLNLTIAITLRIKFRNRITATLLLVVLVGGAGLLIRDYQREMRNCWKYVQASVTSGLQASGQWPPVVGQAFPNLILYDQDGNLTPLSSLKGKVLLIEPIGMSCPACIAFAGGRLYGPFDGVAPQPNLDSIDEYLRRFGAVNLDDPRLVYVQLLLFDRALGVPTQADARRWADHFRLERRDQNYVLAGDAALLTDASRQIIPGFFLVDADLVVRADSTGSRPTHDLYTQLIPWLHDLLEEVPATNTR